jgi:hypothetical protein
MRIHLKLLTCAVALMASIAGTNYAQVVPSRKGDYTDWQRIQIERDRTAQAEREQRYQSGSTLQGEQFSSSSQLIQPQSQIGKNNPLIVMPPRRPLSALLKDSDIFTELDDGTPAPQTDQK